MRNILKKFALVAILLPNIAFASTADYCVGFANGYAKEKRDAPIPQCPNKISVGSPKADYDAGFRDGVKTAQGKKI